MVQEYRICQKKPQNIKLQKDTSGITLLSLVITIVVMLILTGITITAGVDSIQSTKRTSLIAELEMIQEKVNTIYEKRKLNEENTNYYNALGQSISSVDMEKLGEVLKETSLEGYRYFSKEDLRQLDLENMTQDVIINFDTADVVSITGVKIDEIIYYRLTDIPNYLGKKIEHINKNSEPPTFEVRVYPQSNFWKIRLEQIKYNSNVVGGTLSYQLKDSSNWIIVGETMSFEVNQSRTI